MTKEERELFIKIREHLANLHEKWTNDKNKDGHCKSSEGYVSITANYPNWFEAESEKEKYLSSKPTYSISVYSYLFGPSRMHDFSSFEEAWEEVKNWDYKEEFYEETAPNKFINSI